MYTPERAPLAFRVSRSGASLSRNLLVVLKNDAQSEVDDGDHVTRSGAS